MNTAEHQPHSPHQGGEVTFRLQLNCLARNSSEAKLLKLSSFPTSVGDIKKAIQKEFSIPSCVQTLSYHSIPLTGSGSLLDACKHIRSHDTLTVDYSCEADVEKIDEVVGWVREVTQALHREKTVPNANGVHVSSDILIRRGARSKYDLVLALEIFDWMDAKAYVNKIYFMDNGGLEAVLFLYKILLEQKWVDMAQTCQFLEAFCSHTFANFGETLYLRRVLVGRDGLDMATRSLLRVRMQIEGDQSLMSPEAGSSDYSQYALKRILENALHTICNLSELPECQVFIVSHPFILHQALCISLSPSFRSGLSVLVSELFLCLAHNPGAHRYLAKPYIFQALSKVWSKFEAFASSRKEYLLSTALRCFTYMVYAQIAVVSSHLLPLDVIRSLTTCMQHFLSTANPSDIIEYEEDQVCVWATLLPYLKLFYLPTRASLQSPNHCSGTDTTSGCSNTTGPQSESASDSEERLPMCIDKQRSLSHGDATSSEHMPPTPPMSSTHSQPTAPCVEESWFSCGPDQPGPEGAPRRLEVESLKQASLSMSLFFLHTKIARECHCKVLQEEGLVDFVTCLPWHVAAASRGGAEQVVWELNSHIKLQPPRLFNLARAVLAKEHFGLEKVVQIHSPMDLAREVLDAGQ